LSSRINLRVANRQRTTGTNERGTHVCPLGQRAAFDANGSANYSSAVTNHESNAGKIFTFFELNAGALINPIVIYGQ
jgi:hypothetical protein